MKQMSIAVKNAGILFFFALMLLPDTYAAEITLIDTDKKRCILGIQSCAYLRGEIKSGDLNRLQSVWDLMRRSGKSHFALGLNSRGGSLDEAMQIGRWVRKNRIVTTVHMHEECISACVYVLAAGAGKHVQPLAKVGIHRPYLNQMPKEGVQVAMRKALTESKTYFAEMNIPEQLADAMFSIPPVEVEILTEDKIKFYRLEGRDIVLAEQSELEVAASLGVSRQEYMQLRKRLEDELVKCARTNRYNECSDNAYTEIEETIKRLKTTPRQSR